MLPSPVVLLLAEDNPAHAKAILRCLATEQLARTVHTVSDGQETLDYLFRRGRYIDPETSPRPNLILLDLRMPKLDGFEVLRQIKTSEELRRIPVIILTTSAAEVDVARAYDLHVNSYLVKPADFDQLCELIRDLAQYWLYWNRWACG